MTTRILLVGATGPTGVEVLRAAEAHGAQITAMVRNPAKLDANGVPATETVVGDVLDPESLRRAVEGVDVVICLLGSGLAWRPMTLLSTGTSNLVGAMGAAGVHRLVCVTGMGAGDSRGHGGFVYDRLMLPLLLRQVYADKDRQEDVVRASDSDWVIVRPAFLTDGPPTGQYRELTSLPPQARLRRISRADVADFLLREATNPRYSREVVNLTD